MSFTLMPMWLNIKLGAVLVAAVVMRWFSSGSSSYQRGVGMASRYDVENCASIARIPAPGDILIGTYEQPVRTGQRSEFGCIGEIQDAQRYAPCRGRRDPRIRRAVLA